MNKTTLKTDTLLFPLPVILLAVAGPERPNIVTLAWAGVVCSDPPLISVAIRPARYSHDLVVEKGAFTVNIPSAAMLRQVDFVGSVSGREVDKFAAAGLHPMPAEKVSAPLVAECPVNLECQLRQTLALGAHDLFVAEVLAVHVSDDALVDGKLSADAVSPVAYLPGVHEYRGLGALLGQYGFSKGKPV